MKEMTVKELIETLQKYPLDSKLYFYDAQYEKVHWGLTHVRKDYDGDIIMENLDYGV